MERTVATPSLSLILFFLLASAPLSGCLDASEGIGDGRPSGTALRVGDAFTYEQVVRILHPGTDRDPVFRNDTVTVRVRGPGDAITADGEKVRCLSVMMDRASTSFADATWCLDRSSLELQGRVAMEPAHGVLHADHGYPGSIGTSIDYFLDGLRFPPSETLFRTDRGAFQGNISVPALVTSGVAVEWDTSEDEGRVEGRMIYPERFSNVSLSWNATYHPEVPWPTTIAFVGHHMPPFASQRTTTSTFEAVYTLTDHQPGTGQTMEQDVSVIEGTSSEAPVPRAGSAAPWWSELDPGEPWTRYPLEDAWRFALENDSGLQTYMEDRSVTFPADVGYISLKENEGAAYLYEWNITLCDSEGDCYASISGLRQYQGGVGEQYIGVDNAREFVSSPFRSNPLPHAVSARYRNASIPLEAIFDRYTEVNPDVPVRRMNVIVASVPDGSSPESVAPRDLLVVQIRHGFAWREDQPVVHLQRTRIQTVSSIFDGLTGMPILISHPLDPPDSWTERYVPLHELGLPIH